MPAYIWLPSENQAAKGLFQAGLWVISFIWRLMLLLDYLLWRDRWCDLMAVLVCFFEQQALPFRSSTAHVRTTFALLQVDQNNCGLRALHVSTLTIAAPVCVARKRLSSGYSNTD